MSLCAPNVLLHERNETLIAHLERDGQAGLLLPVQVAELDKVRIHLDVIEQNLARTVGSHRQRTSKAHVRPQTLGGKLIRGRQFVKHAPQHVNAEQSATQE